MAILSAGLNHPVGGQIQYEFYTGGTSYMVNVFTQSGTLYVPVSKRFTFFHMNSRSLSDSQGRCRQPLLDDLSQLSQP